MPELVSNPERTSHQEIAELERLLEAKKQALAAEGKAIPEREAFGEVFRERHGQALAPQAAILRQQPPTLSSDELTGHAEKLKAKAREEQLEDLIALAFSKGITAAADVARQASPWLLDELHDRLQDRYYEHLIQVRQLKPL